MAKTKYLNNKEFYNLLCEYHYNKSIDKNNLKRKLGDYIYKIVSRFINTKKFKNYTFKTHMTSEAYIHTMKAIEKFNPEMSKNPHAYFTKTAENAFIQIIKKEKRERDIQDELKNDFIIRDHQKEMSQINQSKFLDMSLDSINIPVNKEFNPIKIYKKGKFIKEQTKEEFFDNTRNHFIKKYGDDMGEKKFKNFCKRT